MSSVSRADILSEAISWIGTPYLHQASVKGAGCDCLGLVRGIWRALYGPEPRALPPYSPDWAEHNGEETLKSAAEQYFQPVPLSGVQPADVLLFRMQDGAPAKHIAVIEDANTIIHAYWGRSVTRSFLAPYWLRRRAYAFAFPNLSET